MPRLRTKKQMNSTIHGIFSTIDWLVTAFALTLVFIVFEMQAYTIPTGSMADTLEGAHFRLRCEQCGYRYNYGFIGDLYREYRLPENSTPLVDVPIRPGRPRCPSCGYFMPDSYSRVSKGDRIFVAKCIYQFTEPKRWDVVVFKSPIDPVTNFIKRVVAGPGEKLEIIDGDIYINDELARKPGRVQDELWMSVYDNDYQPVKPGIKNFNSHIWRQPFVNKSGSKWNLSEENSTVFRLESSVDEVNTIVYDTRTGNDFRATSAHNDPRGYSSLPICSDLMVRFYVESGKSAGSIGAVLTKYETVYRGRVDLSGELVIEEIYDGGEAMPLASKKVDLQESTRPVLFEFVNVDHQLVLKFGQEKLKYDLGLGSEDAGARRNEIMPMVAIFGSGSLRLLHVAIFKDLHYLNRNAGKIIRAGEGNAFTLGDDEFFVLGDNTANSKDSRLWASPGIGNGGGEYRMGVVPRDYLVGKAFFVYWPGGSKPYDGWKFFINPIPYAGGLKRIAGSSSREI